jgi:hypothetical protein
MPIEIMLRQNPFPARLQDEEDENVPGGGYSEDADTEDDEALGDSDDTEEDSDNDNLDLGEADSEDLPEVE